HRPGTVQLSATAADGSLVDRFEYFLDSGNATSVNVAPAATASISNRPITITNSTTGTLHYVYVRAHDGAGNWGAWSQVPLTVTNPLSPFAEPGLVDPIMAGTALPLTAPVARGIAG